jgi:hypothetical protein
MATVWIQAQQVWNLDLFMGLFWEMSGESSRRIFRASIFLALTLHLDSSLQKSLSILKLLSIKKSLSSLKKSSQISKALKSLKAPSTRLDKNKERFPLHIAMLRRYEFLRK